MIWLAEALIIIGMALLIAALVTFAIAKIIDR
jgi:hypothetical protein